MSDSMRSRMKTGINIHINTLYTYTIVHVHVHIDTNANKQASETYNIAYMNSALCTDNLVHAVTNSVIYKNSSENISHSNNKHAFYVHTKYIYIRIAGAKLPERETYKMRRSPQHMYTYVCRDLVSYCTNGT